MSFLMMVGLVIMGVLLADTRNRLKRLEERQRQAGFGGHVDPIEQRSAAATAKSVATIRVGEMQTDDVPAATPPEAELVHPPIVEAPVVERESVEAVPPPPVLAVAAPRMGFEELFGRKLPIWAGGVTLAVAGVLLVKYSIDVGLLSPAVRVVLGLLFGSALIAGAEGALRQASRVQDVRIQQALAGAGIATLYAAILAAANLYQLVGPMTAFIGLAAVTALAMGLSLRFGSPSAVLGLVGGLAAPALVSAGPPNVPLLCTYLALAIGGLCAVSRTQRWAWLGVGALVGGAGWGAVLLLSGGLDFVATLSVGLLVLVLGTALPLFAFSDSRAVALRGGAALVAAVQMAALVATGGFGLLHWGLYGLLSAAMSWLSGRDEKLRQIPAVGLAVGLLLVAIWPAPDRGQFVLVRLAMIAIYGGPALLRLWRAGGSLIEAGQLAALALAGYAITLYHFRHGTAGDAYFAVLALGAAMVPAAGALIGWTNATRKQDARFAILSISTAIMIALAGLIGLADWMAPVVVGAVAVALLTLSGKAEDRRVEIGALAFLTVAAVCLLVTDPSQLMRLFEDAPTDVAQALLRWGSVAVAAGLFAWRVRLPVARAPLQAGAALLGYGAVAQLVPAAWLAIATALVLLAVSKYTRRLLPAIAVLAALVALWALKPLALWIVQGAQALGGVPMLATGLPDLTITLQRLAGPAILVGIALWRGGAGLGRYERMAAIGLAAMMGGVSLHILYKQLFHLSCSTDVMHRALAERTLWEALLMAAGYALWHRLGQTRAALALVVAGVAHGLWFSVLLHDPLWAEQAVGPVPLANLLLPAFGLPLAGAWLISRLVPDAAQRFARPFDIGRMVIIILFALATLRQLFTGTMLVGTPIGAVENIGWSVVAIALAVGFLLWGIRRGLHDWRIASLILMLAAVAKVFLLDASGLEGLLRIASFLALGFSLIGIGWLYSRYLRIEVS